MLDLDDLLTGLIIEDQNVIPSALARLGMDGQFMIRPSITHSCLLTPQPACWKTSTSRILALSRFPTLQICGSLPALERFWLLPLS